MNIGPSQSMATGATASPVSPEELYQVLVGATSQDPLVLHQSDQRLKSMLGLFGAYDALHNIAAERSVPLPVRQQAIIQFKNEALKNWKSRKCQNDDHRMRIRERCLNFLDEEDQTIADCNQVIVSKLARLDYPMTWPTVVPTLLLTIDTNLKIRYSSRPEDPRSTLLLQRCLQLLNGILREFAAYKMLTGVKTMSHLVNELYAVLYSYYATIAGTFANLDSKAVKLSRTYRDVFLAHQVYKCISKIATWLWQRGDKTGMEAFRDKEPWFFQLFQNSANQVRSLLEMRHNILTSQSGDTPPAFVEILTKHVRHIGKYFRRLSQLSHSRFVLLPGCSDLVMFYWNHVVQAVNGPPDAIQDSPFVLYPVRILVQGMVLFNENLAQWVPVKRDGTPNSNALTRDFVESAVKIIVSKLLPLNIQDLQAWMSDPEEWVNTEDKENDQWEYELRACSERVIIHMSNQFPDYVIPLLQQMFTEIAGQAAPDFTALLQKEALYCAIGRCAGRLNNVIPFEQWASETLVSEAQNTDSNYPIIKRRIAWLIGKWARTALNPNMHVGWQIIMHLLSFRGPGTDTVVRLTAAMALRECVDTVEFDINAFQQWLSLAVLELVKLMGEADTLENKRRVDATLNTVIDQAGERITPFAETITQPLPELCMYLPSRSLLASHLIVGTDAGDDLLLKASLLVTVTSLVNAIKGASAQLTHIVVPLVRESLQYKLHLDEDGLALWKAALRNLPNSASSQPYLELIPEALRLLQTNLDVLGEIIDIVDSYTLLAGTQILQISAGPLFRAFRETFQVVSVTSNQKDLIICLNTLITTTPSSLWAESLHVSGLFLYIVKSVLDAEGKVLILTELINLLARIVMADRVMFCRLVTHSALTLGMSDSKVYELLMDAWWTKFDSMSEPKSRKLCAMGVAALVSTGRPEVLERLPSEIFNIWMDVFGEIKEANVSTDDGVNESPLHRHWESADPPYEYFRESVSTPEYDRRMLVWDNDPVRTFKLSTYISERLGEAEAMYGADVFRSRFLSTVDPPVLQQIERELAFR